MSTQAMIGIQEADGSVRAVSCYFDGYPAGVGCELMTYFTGLPDVEYLLSLDDLRRIEGGVAEDLGGASDPNITRTFGNSSAFAHYAANISGCYAYLMRGAHKGKPVWHIREGRGEKGNPRWPHLSRVLKESGLCVPVPRDRPDSVAGAASRGVSKAPPFSARIAVEDGDNSVRSIYCGFDGDLPEAAAILCDTFFMPEAAEDLIALGNLDELGETLDGCSAHYRDMGQDWEEAEPLLHDNVPDFLASRAAGEVTRLYVYIGGDWYYRGANSRVLCSAEEYLEEREALASR